MKNFKMTIVGGGTAGWLCASWFSKFMPNIDITLIESPAIPKIGVGESVTPHVSAFFNELGINDYNFMKNTGSVHKYANRFVGWGNDSDFFSFNYTTKADLLLKDIHYATAIDDFIFDDKETRSTDTVLQLLKDNKINRFDKYFNSQYHYMMENTAPFDGNEYLLNPLYSSAHHINAEMAAEYTRDTIALPNGVKHIQALVNQVVMDGDNIKNLVLDNSQIIASDLFIDASGFHKVLVKSWPIKEYKNMPVDRAYVCQLDYIDQKNELVNYTQSIAQDYGWLFKIGLYHRMGSGYCYNSNIISDETARVDYCDMVNNKKAEPRLIKWNPSRLEKFGKGNTVAIGLSCGFVEPMEANSLYIIVNTISKLHDVLTNFFSTGNLNFNDYNNLISYSIDDIADFILVHYTLSSKQDNDFWKSMHDVGVKENHIDLVYSKYVDPRHAMASSINGVSMFPDYMWAQLAHSWGVDISKWRTDSSALQLDLTQLHVTHLENKHKLISKTRMNNYDWHKQYRFDNMNPSEWQQKYIKG